MDMKKRITAAIAALPECEQSEWDELQLDVSDPLDSLSSWTPEHRTAVRRAIADYAFSQTDAQDVLCEITIWSRRLGAALACTVAREVLHYVPTGEHRPRVAIEAAERWARGEGTAEECRSATAAASNAYATTLAARPMRGINAPALVVDRAYSYVAAAAPGRSAVSVEGPSYAAYYTALAVTAYVYGAETEADAARTDTYDAASAALAHRWHRARKAELERLCRVIGDALCVGDGWIVTWLS